MKSRSVVSDSWRPPQIVQSVEFSRPEYWSGYPFRSPAELPDPGIELGSPASQADSLSSDSPGKAKNTGLSLSLSLLQRNFPTQGSNWSLLHGRRILYQVSNREAALHTLLYIKQINNKVLLYRTGNSPQYLIILFKGRQAEEMHLYMMARSFCSIPGTSMIL